MRGRCPRASTPVSDKPVTMETRKVNSAPAERFRANIGEEMFKRLLSRLSEVNRNIRTRGIRAYNNRRDLVTGYSYSEFYDWDLYFENLYLSYYGIATLYSANTHRRH